MNCTEAKKLIQEYLDGAPQSAALTAHLAQCPACRAELEALTQQHDLLSALLPQGAPSFDLRAAKRKKRAQTARILRSISAAAAVFVVVLTAGAMLTRQAAFSEAPRTAQDTAAAVSEFALEEAAPAESEYDDSAETVPAEADCDGIAYDTLCDEAADTMTAKTALPAWDVEIILSEADFSALRTALEEASLPCEADESRIICTVTEQNCAILSQYCETAPLNTTVAFFK